MCKEREQTKKNSKSSILISSDYFKQYCCSDHIIKIFKVFEEIKNDPEVAVEETIAIDVRNYLMMTLCFTNCLGASNLINVTLYNDVLNAKEHEK